MFTKQNTKQKVYKHVMFIKQKVYIQVMFTKQSFTNTVCLQNKNLQISYVYKTTTVYKHVMFTKQNNTKQKVYKHVIFIKQTFTNKLCLQNKTKVYKHIMFTKHILLSRRVNFEPFHHFSVFHSHDFANFT